MFQFQKVRNQAFGCPRLGIEYPFIEATMAAFFGGHYRNIRHLTDHVLYTVQNF